jgi:hypothetical protein
MNQKTFPPSVFFWPAGKIISRISQPVDPTMLLCVDLGTIPSKPILLKSFYMYSIWVDVIYAGKTIMLQKSHLLIVSTLDVNLVA